MDELRPAFFVDSEVEPTDDDPPLDGLDFLRRVKWESKRIPSVTTAKIDPEILKQNRYQIPQFQPTQLKVLEGIIPTKQWENNFISYFKQLRKSFEQLHIVDSNELTLHNLPHGKDELGWKNFCFGYTNKKTKQNIAGNPPLLSILLKLDHLACLSLLNFHANWFEEQAILKLETNRAIWLFGLLTKLEFPIGAETAFNLRTILRKCSFLRANVAEVSDEQIPHLNIIIAIIGKFFQQQEPEHLL